jgi:hypothetical protein
VPTNPVDTRFEIALNMDLQLDDISNPTRISGELGDYTHSSHIQIERIFTWSRGNNSPLTGVYTFLFSATQQPDPPGTGFGRMVVSPSGYAVWSGRTPDGRPFAQGAYTTIYNNWPVWSVMAGRVNGIFTGWVNFANQSGSDFTAQLTWIGPEAPGPNHAFVPQFVTTVNVAGGLYVIPPRGTPALQLNSNTNNVHITLTDGGLDNEIDRDVTMDQYSRIFFTPRLLGDSLAVSPATGLASTTRSTATSPWTNTAVSSSLHGYSVIH